MPYHYIKPNGARETNMKTKPQPKTPRQLIQQAIGGLLESEIGVSPIEITITRAGAELVFSSHDDFVKAFRWFKYGDGRQAAKIVEVDFSEDSQLRHLVIDPLAHGNVA